MEAKCDSGLVMVRKLTKICRRKLKLPTKLATRLNYFKILFIRAKIKVGKITPNIVIK